MARGTATLPLTGNLANLNRFLHSTEHTTAAARITDTLSLNIAGVSIEIAKTIFFIAVILFLVSAVVGLARGRTQL